MAAPATSHSRLQQNRFAAKQAANIDVPKPVQKAPQAANVDSEPQTISAIPQNIRAKIAQKRAQETLKKNAAEKALKPAGLNIDEEYPMRELTAKGVDMVTAGINSTLATIDASTLGMTSIFSITPYAFSFGWATVQTIYGDMMAKGKDKFVPPLRYRIIDNPADPNANWLKAAVLAGWFLIILVLIIFGTYMLTLLYAIFNPIDFFTNLFVSFKGSFGLSL